MRRRIVESEPDRDGDTDETKRSSFVIHTKRERRRIRTHRLHADACSSWSERGGAAASIVSLGTADG